MYRPSKAEFTECASITGAAFYRYFDSWTEVLDAAAAATNEPALTVPRESVTDGHIRLSRDELLADLRAGRNALGKIPSMPEYEAMGEYSASTYQRRFGSRYAALVAAFGNEVPEARRHDYPANDTDAEKSHPPALTGEGSRGGISWVTTGPVFALLAGRTVGVVDTASDCPVGTVTRGGCLRLLADPHHVRRLRDAALRG